MAHYRRWTSLIGVILVAYNLWEAINMTTQHGFVVVFDPLVEGGTTTTSPKSRYLLAANESFAACVMTSDDNALLSEWIAYHYTVLPLRALVVANDPRSRQSPLDVLNKWANGTNSTGIPLQHWLWTDSDYMDPSQLELAQKTLDEEGNHYQLKLRQKYFISECSKFLKKLNHTWVSFVDSDEFIVFNKVLEQDDGQFRYSNDGARSIPNTTVGEMVRIRELMQNNGTATIIDAIQYLQQVVPKFGPCHTMPRLLHGSLETVNCNTSQGPITSSDAESLFWKSTKNLTTLRYMQHAGKNNFDSKWGKVIMDVSNLDDSLVYQTLPRNIHRPYPDKCIFPSVSMAEAPFRVHHYIGSWERFNSRSHDSRRTKDAWLSRSTFDLGNSCDLDMHKWLLDFVDLVGVEQAGYLLSWR